MLFLSTKLTILAIKDYTWKGKNRFSKKGYLPWGLNLGPDVFYSDTFLTELTWQVNVVYLTSLLFVHQLSFGFNKKNTNRT